MNVRRAIEAVAGKLGNTPTICRKCYIHPEIVACYMEGTLPSVAMDAASAATGSALPREEAAVLRLLKRRLAPGRKARNTTMRRAALELRRPAIDATACSPVLSRQGRLHCHAVVRQGHKCSAQGAHRVPI